MNARNHEIARNNDISCLINITTLDTIICSVLVEETSTLQEIKKLDVEKLGIEPNTSRMLSERSTI